MNQYRISILIDAETKEQALINLAETIDQHQDLSGVFSVEHVYASEPPRKTQPHKGADGAYLCPFDETELVGDGENGFNCPKCGWYTHEASIQDVEAWLGSDNTQEEAIKTIAQVASGEYKPEELRKDINNYNK